MFVLHDGAPIVLALQTTSDIVWSQNGTAPGAASIEADYQHTCVILVQFGNEALPLHQIRNGWLELREALRRVQALADDEVYSGVSPPTRSLYSFFCECDGFFHVQTVQIDFAGFTVLVILRIYPLACRSIELFHVAFVGIALVGKLLGKGALPTRVRGMALLEASHHFCTLILRKRAQ